MSLTCEGTVKCSIGVTFSEQHLPFRYLCKNMPSGCKKKSLFDILIMFDYNIRNRLDYNHNYYLKVCMCLFLVIY